MTQRKSMSVHDLLQWAHDETTMADGLERLLPDLPPDLQAAMRGQIQSHRDRARWLDMQVADYFDRLDENRE